jgi:hypothetical protein
MHGHLSAGYTYVYSLLNSLTSSIGNEDRFATKTWPASFSLTGSLGAYWDGGKLALRQKDYPEID